MAVTYYRGLDVDQTPPETLVGDTLVAQVIAIANSGDAAITAPAGWTLLQEHTFLYNDFFPSRSAIFTKVADVAGLTTHTFTIPDPFVVQAIIVGFRGATVGTSDKALTTSGTSISFPSITTTVPETFVLLLGQAVGSENGIDTLYSYVPPTGAAPLYPMASGEGTNGGYDYFIQSAPGATGARTAPISFASDGLPAIAFSLALEPTGGGGEDTTAPTITSPGTHSVKENIPYTATATADEAVTWAKGGTNAALVTLNTATGQWSVAAQDYETRTSVVFTLTATDAAGNASAAQTVTLSITNDATPPGVTSFHTHSVMEGETYTATPTSNDTGEALIWSVSGADAALITIDPATGIWSLGPQDYATKPQVLFTLRVTDIEGNTGTQSVTVNVTQAPLIRFIGAATGTTSAAIPAHQAGDLILAFAFRDGSTTLPTLPAGEDWATVLAPAGANTASMRLAAKIADGSAENTGTFTSATSLVVLVYRPRPGYALAVGASASATASSTTISIPALALQDTGGTSWVAGFAGHRSINTSLETAPTGMAARASVLDATDEAAAYDSNGGSSAWTLKTRNVGGTASGWFGAAVEIRVTSSSAPAATPWSFGWIIG